MTHPLHTPPCPREEELERFLNADSSSAANRSISEHVAICERCQEWLKEARADEALLAELRGKAIGDPTRGRTQPEADLPAHVAAFSTETTTQPGARAPSEFAGYEVVKEISRGGQGVVYQAVQVGTKRRVALKVLLDGAYASLSAKRRFEREIELVAQLQHPNIVPVFHSGLTDDGRPFCVMDYIAGMPLDRYVREKKLTLREILELFRKVCEAVQYAHQKGMIHRDLKPSNILVSEASLTGESGAAASGAGRSVGEPKIVDFGLAKLLAGPIDSLLTHSEQLVGTLRYMAPEQARGRHDAVDTCTDVYALGIILYELLTGTFPYAVTGPVADVLHRIGEQEPTPPSTNWSPESGVESRASRRRAGGRRPSGGTGSSSISPGSTRCPIDGDVDTIVLKAIAKERESATESAGALGRDIGRFLAGEPLEAKRDSAWYVLSKLLRRHRMAIAVAALCFFLLAAGLVTALSLWRLSEHHRVIASEQRDRAELALKSAEQRHRETQEVASFQTRMLNEIDLEAMGEGLLRRMREQVALGLERREVGTADVPSEVAKNRIAAALAAYDETTLLANPTEAAPEILDEHVLRGAAEASAQAFVDQPLVEAAIRLEVGKMYRLLGMLEDAEPHLQRALLLRERELGRSHADVARAVTELALLFQNRGQFEDAEPLLREALAINRTMLRRDHQEVAATLDGLAGVVQAREAEEAESLAREALAIKRNSDDAESIAIGLNNLGLILLDLKKDQEAELLWREVLDDFRDQLGEDSPVVAASLNNFSKVLWLKGDHAAAASMLEEVLALDRRVYGDLHPFVAKDLSNLARVRRAQKDYLAAERLYREALEIRLKRLPNHRDTSVTRVGLGITLTQLHRFQEAEEQLLTAYLAKDRAELPPKLVNDIVRAMTELFEAWHVAEPGEDYDSKANTWRTRLDQ